ncbi:MAG TPA: NUDIX domain-containing protein [Flavisolibacter sp.]
MLRFNVRVYGLLITEEKQVLVSDERIRGGLYTKFPGGGLEYGEGTRDGLKREFMEELGLRVEVGEHIYTTDYFQPSAFHPDQQMISIYYYVHPLEPIKARLAQKPFDFIAGDDKSGEAESFRLVPWEEFGEEAVTLPIDKIVARLLKETSVKPQ